MNRERRIVSHMMSILALGIGILTLPISIPVVIWTNLWGCADRFSGLPGIKQGGGAVSGIVAFLYVVVLVGAVGAIAVPSSGYDIGFGDSRSDGGASSPATTTASIPTDNPPASNTTESATATRTATATTTSTPTAVPTPTPSPTATRTHSPTPTVTRTPENSRGFENETALRRAQYDVFMESFQEISENTTQMSGAYYSINASNESATFYWTTNKSNQTRINDEWAAVMTHYAGLSEAYREQDNLPVAMIPDRLNFVTFTQDGEIYRRSHVDYMSAWRYTMNVSSVAQYMLLYYYHAEKGPGHPDYEPTPTPTEAKTAS